MATPVMPMSSPATAGPHDAGGVEGRGVEGHGVGQVFSADHLDDERLARGHVHGVAQAEEEREHQDVPDLYAPADAVNAKRLKARSIWTNCVTMSVRRLGKASAMRPPKRPNTSTGRNWAAVVRPQDERVARELEDEPGLGDRLHPRPHQRDRLAAEEQPVVAVAEDAPGVGECDGADEEPEPRAWARPSPHAAPEGSCAGSSRPDRASSRCAWRCFRRPCASSIIVSKAARPSPADL